MPSDQLEILREAIARNTSVRIAPPVGAAHQPETRTRFLAVEAAGIWVESWDTPQRLDDLISGKLAMTLSFKQQVLKVEFSARVLERRAAYPVNGSTTVAAVLVEAPAAVKALQRRENYRVGVSIDSSLATRFWCLHDRDSLSAEPNPHDELKIDVRDLSVGGIGGLHTRRKTDGHKLFETQRLCVRLQNERLHLLLDARVSFLGPVPDPDQHHVGVAFVLDTNQLVDRQKMQQLEKLITQLQRHELRRKRGK